MATTSQGAKKLRAVMQEMGGEISVDGAREILAAEGLSDRDLGFAMIYGQGRRRWWKRSEDKQSLELIEPAGAGPGPGSPAGAGPSGSPAGAGPVPAPVAALASPEDRVRATAVQLGISDKLAGTIAAYSSNFDLNSPSQIWGMLGGVPEVGVSARKRLFETLCRSQGLEPSEQLSQLVDSARVDGLQLQPARRRTYIARAGEVLALDDGEEGLSFGQAIMAADLQVAKMRLAAESAREPEGLSGLDRIIPGLSDKIADLLFSPPRSAAGPGVPISLGGQNLSVSEETFMKMQDAEVKRDAVNLVKENLPKLWEVAQDLAKATDRAYDKFQGKESAKETLNFACGGCGRRVHVPASVAIFQCRECGTEQDARTGQLLYQAESGEDQVRQDQPVWERCINCSETFQVLGESLRCPHCNYDPKLAAVTG